MAFLGNLDFWYLQTPPRSRSSHWLESDGAVYREAPDTHRVAHGRRAIHQVTYLPIQPAWRVRYYAPKTGHLEHFWVFPHVLPVLAREKWRGNRGRLNLFPLHKNLSCFPLHTLDPAEQPFPLQLYLLQVLPTLQPIVGWPVL